MTDAGSAAGRSAQVPADVSARFAAAEARLYPVAVLDPGLYQRALELCGLVLTELRSRCADVTSVLDRRASLVSALPAQAAAAGLSLQGFEAETVVDAASAVRCRELVQAAAEAAREDRLEQARAAGREWVVEEPDLASVMAGVHRQVEVHVRTGTTLVGSVESGGSGTPTVYRLEVVEPTGSVETSRTFTNRDEWQREVERCRASIAGRP